MTDHDVLSVILTGTCADLFDQSVLIFGDPDNGQPVGNISASIVQVYCHVGDGICAGLGILTPSHGTYDNNALEAAEWIATTLGYS